MSRIPGSCGSSAAPPCHHCAMQKGQSSEQKWIFQAVRQYGDNLGMLFFKFTCSWNIRCHVLQEIRLYVKKLLVYLKSQICRYTVYYVNECESMISAYVCRTCFVPHASASVSNIMFLWAPLRIGSLSSLLHDVGSLSSLRPSCWKLKHYETPMWTVHQCQLILKCCFFGRARSAAKGRGHAIGHLFPLFAVDAVLNCLQCAWTKCILWMVLLPWWTFTIVLVCLCHSSSNFQLSMLSNFWTWQWQLRIIASSFILLALIHPLKNL